MKTFYGSLLFIALTIIVAQASAQVQFGVKFGGNVCNMKFDIDRDYGDEPETKAKMGYHLGLITDIELIEETLSLQPALLYSNKGYSVDFEKILKDEADDYNVDIDDYKGYWRYNYNYIELPINVVYKYKGLQLSAGPYVAFGIWGQMRVDFSFKVDGERVDSKDIFDEDKYKLQPVWGKVDDNKYDDFLDDDDVAELWRAIDAGLNLGIGYQVNNILFNIGYSFGLVNMTPVYDADDYDMDEDVSENIKQKNRVFSFSMSVFFN
jgi:hypothetical protein